MVDFTKKSLVSKGFIFSFCGLFISVAISMYPEDFRQFISANQAICIVYIFGIIAVITGILWLKEFFAYKPITELPPIPQIDHNTIPVAIRNEGENNKFFGNIIIGYETPIIENGKNSQYKGNIIKKDE